LSHNDYIRKQGRDHSMHEVLTEAPDLLRKPPDLRLDGRVAWVTGASQGLGRAIALAMAGAGAELLLTARNDSALNDVARLIHGAGGSAEVVRGSVTEPGDIAAAIDAADSRWGRLDVLVNNAGVGSSYRRAEQVSDDEFANVVGVNLAGAFACCRAAFPLLQRSSAASVVNVSSVHGHVGGARLAAYAASKGGLELLTRSLALEWAPRGIRVNAIAPGYLVTEMTAGLRAHERLGGELLARVPMGRFGEPNEIAAASLFLASDAASYITGATLLADGGWSAQ
jgi:NAD(P)-dependent dehydrogenase (short-subunit alcohol dehydrogenase family)